MTEHIKYEFYKTEYLIGKKAVIDEASFAFYIRQALKTLMRYAPSLSDISELPECAMLCACEIAEVIYKNDEAERKHGGISSESVGGWSQSYESTDTAMQNQQKKIKGIVYKWLSGTGLLYRGVKRKRWCAL